MHGRHREVCGLRWAAVSSWVLPSLRSRAVLCGEGARGEYRGGVVFALSAVPGAATGSYKRSCRSSVALADNSCEELMVCGSLVDCIPAYIRCSEVSEMDTRTRRSRK